MHPEIAGLRQDGKYADKSWICFFDIWDWLVIVIFNESLSKCRGKVKKTVVDEYYCIPTLVVCCDFCW